MCGRFGFISIESKDGQSNWFRLLDDEGVHRKDQLIANMTTRYDIRPTQMTPVIKKNITGKTSIESLKWGFHPVWSKGPIINTRMEKLFSSKFWKKMVIGKRCLVPASFFYEWKEEGKIKVPYMIKKKDGNDFLFAGLWDHEKDLKTGQDILSFSILTQDANEIMREIHNFGGNKFRQPVIIDDKNLEKWVNGKEENEDEIISMIRQYSSDEIEVIRLKKTGNDSEHIAPEV
jgi:putative SOS response-associated peptidase YedK